MLALPIFTASRPATIVGGQMSLTSVFGMGTGGPSSPINTNSSIFFSLAPLPRALSFVVTRTGFEPMLTA